MYSLRTCRCPLVSIILSPTSDTFVEYVQTVNIPNEVVTKPLTTFAPILQIKFFQMANTYWAYLLLNLPIVYF